MKKRLRDTDESREQKIARELRVARFSDGKSPGRHRVNLVVLTPNQSEITTAT